MSEYQRFISYMYEYRGNNRHTNCGYARIDNRNQVLKLEIHMKISSQSTEEPIHIYGCFQRDGQLYGVELGQHIPALGMLNWRIQCSAQNLAGSDIDFSNLEGLILIGQSPLSYCSIWNDQSIRPMDMIPYPSPESEELSSPEPEPESDTSVLPEAVPDETITDDAAPDANVPDSVSESPDLTSESVEAQNPEATVPEDTDVESTAAQTCPSTQTSARDDLSAPSPSVITTPRTQPTLVERIMAQEYTASPEDTSTKSSSQPVNPNKTAPRSASTARWDRLLCQYPRSDAFTEGELKNCVRVEPRDFPRLRREGWNIAGNRFILHCFQRNAHCLIGRIGDTEQYVFAVPGVYDNQERFMANMFGFPCFKAIDQDAPLDSGQKGYWYRSLH